MPLIAVLILWLLASVSNASEFPERECCDITTPEATSSTTTVPAKQAASAATGFHVSGSNTKSTVAILNCLLARQLCFEDASCSAILEIIPRVCGAEIVACSTVTVTKCQAALRTLQAFPFFKPTCLCREPHVDPDCNFFRDFLFDHPCMFVKEKEKDHYPIDALPTCTHAHFVCQQEPKCIKFYEEFKAHCKVRDNYCRMEDRYKCFESWTNLRRSPMFGCICPNNHMKKRCDRIFSMVNHNPCIASDNTSTSYSIEIGNHVAFKNPLVDATNGLDAHAGFDYISITVLNNRPYSTVHHRPQYPEQEEEVQSVSHLPHSILHASPPDEQRDNFIFQSTCHLAMNSCNDNYHCKRMLAPILLHCDISHCNRNSCMEALQAFYGKPNFHWNFEIAFCICKKTDHKDACLIAQEKLHPICAQRSEETLHPTCLSIADACEENKDCRTRLESYEQSCAVDSVTKKCAGLPSECQKSILSILGTDLRTSCGCKGADTGQVYDCLAWQRLLWVNPCVVEAQKHFHRKKAAELALLTASHSSDTSTISTTTTVRITTSIHVHAVKSQTESSQTANTEIAEFVPPPQAFVPTSTHTASLTTSATTMTTKITTSTRTTTGVPTTTMTTITTTIPPKSCVVQRPQFPDQYINEGTLKRIYHEDEFECSDVCECEIGEKLSCRTICIDRMPCKTEFAFYNHAAPAYQAFRGRCLCYSGRFICMKPLPTDYSLPHGVYLFLGYSEVDERELNKNHTTHLVIIQDVVRVLQNFISEINDTLCTLECYNVTKENVIIVGKLADEVDVSRLTPAEILTREKEECANLLEIVSDRINSKNPDFISHILLSIFKMAEVEIIPIESTSGGAFSTIKEIKGVFKPYMCRFEANYSQRPYNFKD